MKSVQIQSYFWSIFSCIRTEYGDLLRIQSEYRKIWTRNNSVFGQFSLSVDIWVVKIKVSPRSGSVPLRQLNSVHKKGPSSLFYHKFVGNKAKGQISKRLLQQNKARQIFWKNEHFLPSDTHTYVWRALFCWNTRFEIRNFALLPTNYICFFIL